MSDTSTVTESPELTKVTKPQPTGLAAVQGTRKDGASFSLVPSQIKKGTSAGDWTIRFDSGMTKEQVIAYLGDDLVKFVVPKLNQRANGWLWEAATETAKDKDGDEYIVSVDMSKVEEQAASFSARGDSMPDLKLKLADLLEQLSNIVDTKPEGDPEIAATMMAVLAINKDIANKKRERVAKTEVAA